MICTFCNTEYEITQFPDTQEDLIMADQKVCFECALWLNLLERMKKPNHHRIIVAGNMYYVGSEGSQIGHKFIIEALNPPYEKFTSTNLRHNGEIPEHFRELLPDTHKFIGE